MKLKQLLKTLSSEELLNAPQLERLRGGNGDKRGSRPSENPPIVNGENYDV